MSAAIEKAIQEDERRARRDAYREAGGSKRRPLKSFYTKDEKKARREAHRDMLAAAIGDLEDRAAFEAWLESLDLNPQLTACNALLAAYQSPGEIIGTSRSWSKQGYHIPKGEHAAGRITAPGFWPLPYFTAGQVLATDLEDAAAMVEPAPADVVERLHAQTLAGLATGDKARLVLDGIAETYRGARVSLWGSV